MVETRETASSTAQPEALQPKYQWVWSPRYIDAPILRDDNADTDGQCDDARLYFLTDANMNVTTLVDTAGDALERYTYTPYGEVTFRAPDWSLRASSPHANATLYTGRTLDEETGLYFYRARYYSAELGRFLARDPICYAAEDHNLYRYVLGQPTIRLDPLGEKYSMSGPPTNLDECLNEARAKAWYQANEVEWKYDTLSGLIDDMYKQKNAACDKEWGKFSLGWYTCRRAVSLSIGRMQGVLDAEAALLYNAVWAQMKADEALW